MTHIIGDRKPSRVDPTLAKRLNEEEKLQQRNQRIKEPEVTKNLDSVKVSNSGKYFLIENIDCVGSDGKVFEHYDQIEVAKDIAREPNGDPKLMDTYRAIAYMEEVGSRLFLPSFALQCNILAALHPYRGDERVMKLLMQYNNSGPLNRVIHTSNTIIGREGAIYHYPKDENFLPYTVGRNKSINPGQHIVFNFPEGIETETKSLEDALKVEEQYNFIRDISGLRDPSILIEIAEYLGKPATFISPSTLEETYGAFIGCLGQSLMLDCKQNTYYGCVVRPVHLPETNKRDKFKIEISEDILNCHTE